MPVVRDQDMRLFDANLAKEYGLDEAIFHYYLLDKLYGTYMLKKYNQRAGDNLELVVTDGQPWIPRTHKEFCEDLPFWTEKQIRRIIASCKSQGLIEIDNYNPNPMHRCKWYTLRGVTVDGWGAR